MKKVILRGLATAMVLLMTTLTISAQPGGGQGGSGGQRGERPSPEEMAERMTERMTEVLELTEKQSDDFYEIQVKYLEEQGDERRLSEEKEKERSEEIKGILTPEQLAKYEELMKQMAEQRGQRGQGGQGQGGQRPSRQ